MRKNHSRCKPEKAWHKEDCHLKEVKESFIESEAKLAGEKEELQQLVMTLQQQVLQATGSRMESILETIGNQHSSVLSKLDRLKAAVEAISIKESDSQLQIQQSLIAHHEQLVSIKEDLKRVSTALGNLQKSTEASAAPFYFTPKKMAIEKKFIQKK